MNDLSQMAEPVQKPSKKKTRPKKRTAPKAASQDPKHHGVHVNVHVINQSGEGHSKKSGGNSADDVLARLRGY